jgi:hypothetical protein
VSDDDIHELRQQAFEMRQRAVHTAMQAAAWPAPPEQPKRPAPLAVSLRAGAVDGKIYRRTQARMRIERELRREAEQTKLSEAEQRAEWRSQNAIVQIMTR